MKTTPIVACLLLVSACATQGISPVNSGDYRVAGSSGGAGYAAWDDEFYDHDAGTEIALQAGRMMTDQFEVGVEATVGLGIGSAQADESFSFALDPGIYGRYYFSPIGGGFTPWINVDAIIGNAVRTGIYDNDFDPVFIGEVELGATTFLADRLAVEYAVFLGGYIDDGTDSEWVDLTDTESLLFSIGLSFYF